jgi:hypothetical protein
VPLAIGNVLRSEKRAPMSSYISAGLPGAMVLTLLVVVAVIAMYRGFIVNIVNIVIVKASVARIKREILIVCFIMLQSCI